MPRADTWRGTTLVDSSRLPPQPAHCRLICIGSPEDGFVDAGRTFPLAGLTRVEFHRGKRKRMSATIEDGVLRVSTGHPWVSGHHADLELTESVVLCDRNSRNGTLVEGDMIDQALLASGDVFEIGRCFWMLRQTRAATPEGNIEPLMSTAHPEFACSVRALRRLAPTRVPVLLVGETGVGKRHLAREIHNATGRGGPFVSLNAVARSLESTGAAGVLAKARGGTLFLDDVGGLSLAEQAGLVSSLLAAMPAASDPLDLPKDGVRLIAASSEDLHLRCAEERFRGDLYARLAGYECRLPSLRERREDLGVLLRALTPKAERLSVNVDVFRTLLAHKWTFNIRELSHSLASALALREPDAPISAAIWREVQWPDEGIPVSSRLTSVRQTIVRELATHGGDKGAVAKSLGCEVADIERWVTRFDLTAADFG